MTANEALWKDMKPKAFRAWPVEESLILLLTVQPFQVKQALV